MTHDIPVGDEQPILILSSSLLTDRMLQYTGLVQTIARERPVVIWATSHADTRLAAAWSDLPATVETFPEIAPNPEVINVLRRVNEYAWDYRLRIPSRKSMDEHVRSRRLQRWVRALKVPGRVVALLGAHRFLEHRIEAMLSRVHRSPEGERRLAALRPAAVVTMNPFWYTEPAIAGIAKRHHVPTIAFIPSWDNLSTKGRMVFDYDSYIVWSEQARAELAAFYRCDGDRVRVVGAPQFDVFFNERFREPRETFCARVGLDPTYPIITYAIGSPNFLREQSGAVDFARRVAAGELGNVQLLVRPHPIHARADLVGAFECFAPRVRVQEVGRTDAPLVERTQTRDEILEWVSTFRHSNVVVNLSSTVTVDAALFDRSVVNLDYDPHPDGRDNELIHEINSTWNHFGPVARSGGVWLAESPDDVVLGVMSYLADPSLHAEGRRRITEFVCGTADGRSGERFGDAVLSLLGRLRPSVAAA